MELNDYQKKALRSDQVPVRQGNPHMVPLLGLAGEVGELLSEYKKHLRDGDAHELFPSRVSEELGDILWYVAAVAERFGLDLEDVAAANLQKCADTWMAPAASDLVSERFDGQYPETERFPKKFTIRFEEVVEGDVLRVRAYFRDKQMGQTLTDNAHADDGYRFHDVFHLGLVAGLGWSPVSRRNLGLKRKSDPETDEVEDGGRAIVIEEGVTALVYSYAVEHNWLRGVQRIDHDVLKVARKMTSHLEVRACTLAEWESAILGAFPVWLDVLESRGGEVEVSLVDRRLRFLGP